LPYSDTGLCCVDIFSEHFAENGITLWCTVAKIVMLKLCAIFLEHLVLSFLTQATPL